VIEALADQVELNSLVMTANKQSWLAAAQGRLADGVAAIQAGANGLATAAGLSTAPATTQPEGDETAGITNRSPRTINNTYPPPPAVTAKSDAPWVALIAIALLIATALGLAWMMGQPKATTTAPTSTAPVQQGVALPNTQWSASPFDPFAQPAATK
jgi:hypothetical protein